MIASLLASTYSALKTKGALCVLSLMLLAGPVWTQTQLGTLFGTITDSTGAVLPGVKITVVNSGTGLNRNSTTDTDGQYHLVGLAARNGICPERLNVNRNPPRTI